MPAIYESDPREGAESASNGRTAHITSRAEAIAANYCLIDIGVNVRELVPILADLIVHRVNYRICSAIA